MKRNCAANDEGQLTMSCSNPALAVSSSYCVREYVIVCGVQTDVDECENRPCLNGATCRDQTNGYSCSACPLNVTGFNCERSTYTHTVKPRLHMI